MRRLALPAAGLAGLALAVVPALASHQEIVTSGNAFTPDETAVKPAENHQVTIRNASMGFHNLHWEDGAPGEPLATHDAPSGDPTNWSVTRTFDTEGAGEYDFFCTVHNGMRGTVHVNAAGTVPSGGGGTTTTSTTPPPPPGGTTTTSTTPPPPPPGGTTTTPPPPGSDTTPPVVSNARARATRRGVRIVLSVNEPVRITVRVLRRGRRIVRRTFTRPSGVAVLRIRRALRRGRYSVRLALVDAAGNASTRRLRARVR